MKQCPKCGLQNPDNAVFCAKCATNLLNPTLGMVAPAALQQKTKKKYTALIVVAVIIVVVIWLGIFASIVNSNDESETNNNESDNAIIATDDTDDTPSESENGENITEPEQTEPEQTEAESDDGIIKVGESFESRGLKVTVDSYNPDFTDYEYEFNAPKDGMRYIEVGFTYENVGNGSDKYVSIYDCDCYADNTICEQNYMVGDNDFINANISAGRNVSFKVYFEVPVSANEIELEYDSSFWSDKKVVIKLQ